MLIRRPRGWEIPERETTPEALWTRRRTLGAGLGMIAGTKQRTDNLAAVAFGFALCALFLAKLMMLAWTPHPGILSSPEAQAELQVAVATHMLSEPRENEQLVRKVRSYLLDEEDSVARADLGADGIRVLDEVERRAAKLIRSPNSEITRPVAQKRYRAASWAGRASLHVSPWDLLWMVVAMVLAWLVPLNAPSGAGRAGRAES